MKKNVSITQSIAPLLSYIRRFHTILFFLLVSGGLFVAILSLLSVIAMSSSSASSSDQAVDGTFDQATIDKVKNGDAASISTGKRTSPFTE